MAARGVSSLVRAVHVRKRQSVGSGLKACSHPEIRWSAACPPAAHIDSAAVRTAKQHHELPPSHVGNGRSLGWPP